METYKIKYKDGSEEEVSCVGMVSNGEKTTFIDEKEIKNDLIDDVLFIGR